MALKEDIVHQFGGPRRKFYNIREVWGFKVPNQNEEKELKEVHLEIEFQLQDHQDHEFRNETLKEIHTWLMEKFENPDGVFEARVTDSLLYVFIDFKLAPQGNLVAPEPIPDLAPPTLEE